MSAAGRPGDALGGLAEEAAQAARVLEGRPAEEVVAWAVERFGDGLVLTSSFQDCVLVDIALRVEPSVTVAFLDTGSHFPETLAYLRRVERRYKISVVVLLPGPEAAAWPCGTERCCELRKVRPLARFLASRSAWMTGIKRVDTPERRTAPVVAFEPRYGVVKVNPIVSWTEDDVRRYVAARGLPRHPLNAAGYVSIGCAPTTGPPLDGSDPRSGRWPGTAKTECGLH